MTVRLEEIPMTPAEQDEARRRLAALARDLDAMDVLREELLASSEDDVLFTVVNGSRFVANSDAELRAALETAGVQCSEAVVHSTRNYRQPLVVSVW